MPAFGRGNLRWRRKCATVVPMLLLALSMVTGPVLAADASPQYEALECWLAPTTQYVSSGQQATFNAEWCGGPAPYWYTVRITYGDGTTESLPSPTSMEWYTFSHFYPPAQPGTTWTATLYVTNGTTTHTHATVTVRVP